MTRTHVRMKKDDRRARILAAAIDIIGDRGFRSFSVRDLAIRCEMTDAGLLHHFGSKTALLTAVLDERDRQDELAVSAALESDTDRTPCSVEGVRHILRTLVQSNKQKPELIRLYSMLRVEALAVDHPAHGYFKQRDLAARRLFSELLAPVTTDPVGLARQILIAIEGLELQWLCEDQAFDLVAEWDKLSTKLVCSPEHAGNEHEISENR